MNRILSYSNRFKSIEDVVPLVLDEEYKSDVKREVSPLLKYIFGVDPVTGHPTGDLSVYLGDNANPEISLFIERNLMKEVSSNTGNGLSLSTDEINKIRGTITDDDIANFARNHGETREEYADRIRGFLDRQKLEYQKKKYSDELKRIIGHGSR